MKELLLRKVAILAPEWSKTIGVGGTGKVYKRHSFAMIMIVIMIVRMKKIGEDGGGGVMGVSGKLTFSKKVEAAIDKKVLAQLEIAVTRSFG